MIRTDMAVEVIRSGRKDGAFVNILGGVDGVRRSDVIIDSQETSERFARPIGHYITVEARDLYKRETKLMYAAAKSISSAIIDAAKHEFKRFADAKNILVVGLGNRGMTADALGNRVVERLIVTRHMHEDAKNLGLEGKFGSLSAICPGVMGLTGIESFDIIRGVVEQIKPDFIIAVDTLASRRTERISSSFQITNSGITPGSGVANHRFTLNKEGLGVPVIAVGVPLVVYAKTIVTDVLNELNKRSQPKQADETLGAKARAILKKGERLIRGGKPELVMVDDYDSNGEESELISRELISEVLGDLVVTPKDIDIIVKNCAFVIALAINLAVHRKLTLEEALELMNRE